MPDWRFWLPLPGLLPQALRVRANALRLPAAAGETEGELPGDGPPLRLLLIGDSIIAGVGVAQLIDAFPGQLARALGRRSGRAVQWQALGVGGLDSGEVLQQLLPRIQAEVPFDLACLSVGVNDVTGLTSRRRWRDRLQQLHSGLQQRAHRSLHLGLPPLDRFPVLPAGLRRSFGHRARQLDAIAGRLAAADPCRLHLPMQTLPEADQFAADGFHPNGPACGLWADDVVERLLQAWPELVQSDSTASQDG